MEKEERLQKIIAATGMVSRRKAETMIEQGRVLVNGRVVSKLGAKAVAGRDHIKVDGKLIRQPQEKIYILLNKPRQVICSMEDPQGRLRVSDLVRAKGKVYPVGRLDYNTEGLILLTNDGEFSRIAASAGDHLPKVYHAKVRSTPGEEKLDRLRRGVRLPDGRRFSRCKILLLKEGNNSWYEVTLSEGKNHQVRDLFDSIGHPVVKLRRVRIGFLTDARLPIGHYRFLTDEEVERVLRLDDLRSRQERRRRLSAFNETGGEAVYRDNRGDRNNPGDTDRKPGRNSYRQR
jgi:23S rRNA pseudouridine2605 synthase